MTAQVPDITAISDRDWPGNTSTALMTWACKVVRVIGASYHDLPQWWLFLPIAALGTAGLFL